MFATIYLAWSLGAACPVVNHYRAAGYTDAQIEEVARAKGVPEWVITIAKRRCKPA